MRVGGEKQVTKISMFSLLQENTGYRKNVCQKNTDMLTVVFPGVIFFLYIYLCFLLVSENKPNPSKKDTFNFCCCYGQIANTC